MYLTGSPASRKRIIRDQKRPPDPQYLRYPEAASAITDFLCRGQQEPLLRAHQQRLGALEPQSDFDAHRLRLCQEALEHFWHVFPHIGLSGLAVSLAGEHTPNLEMAGVSIRVRPQVVLQQVARDGKVRVGALKLYFSKHHPLDERSGQYMGTLLQLFAEQHLGMLGQVEPPLVKVVDVFAEKVHEAPRARTRRLTDVQLACEEIAERWPLH